MEDTVNMQATVPIYVTMEHRAFIHRWDWEDECWESGPILPVPPLHPRTRCEPGSLRRKNFEAGFKEVLPGPTPSTAIFTCFKSLPRELRNLIWTAAFPGPRNIILYNVDRPTSYSPDADGMEIVETVIRAERQAIPITLSVCKESRSIAQQFYGPRYEVLLSGEPIYFDPEVDWLCFEKPETVSSFFYGYDVAYSMGYLTQQTGAELFRMRSTLKNIAIPMTLDDELDEIIGKCFCLQNVAMLSSPRRAVRSGPTYCYLVGPVVNSEDEIGTCAIASLEATWAEEAEKVRAKKVGTYLWQYEEGTYKWNFLNRCVFEGHEEVARTKAQVKKALYFCLEDTSRVVLVREAEDYNTNCSPPGLRLGIFEN